MCECKPFSGGGYVNSVTNVRAPLASSNVPGRKVTMYVAKSSELLYTECVLHNS